jgi:hypothetical protein
LGLITQQFFVGSLSIWSQKERVTDLLCDVHAVRVWVSVWTFIVAVSSDAAHVALNAFLPRLAQLPLQALACVVGTLTGPLPGQPTDKMAPTDSLMSLARATGGDATCDLVVGLFERVVRFFFIFVCSCLMCVIALNGLLESGWAC